MIFVAYLVSHGKADEDRTDLDPIRQDIYSASKKQDATIKIIDGTLRCDEIGVDAAILALAFGEETGDRNKGFSSSS